MKTPDTDAAMALTNAIAPLLAGHPPERQSAALADLLATWLASHIVYDDPAATDALRATLLQGHIALVRQLIPVNAGIIHGRRRT